jgi:hypothetical protein
LASAREGAQAGAAKGVKYIVESLPPEVQREIEAWIVERQGRFLKRLSDELKARGIEIGAGALARYAALMEKRARHERLERIVALNQAAAPRAIAKIKEVAAKQGIKLD